MIRWALFLATAPALWPATIPAGTEICLRLNTKIASEVTEPQNSVTATVIAPVVVEGRIVLPSGVHVSGAVKQARAASDQQRAQMELVFTEMESGSYKTKIAAALSSLENARELLDDKGLISGIDGAQTYGGLLTQGIAKLESNDRLAGLAAVISGAKRALNIGDTNANIDYDAGTELNIKLTAPLDWKGPLNGPESKLQSFSNEPALARLVNRQPFRTVAEKPPSP